MMRVSVCILIYTTVILPAFVIGQGILYNVLEEESANTFVGNIIHDANLQNYYSNSVLAALRFRIERACSACPDCFMIGQSTGDVTTTKPIDRDQMCGNSIDCICQLVFKVEPTEYHRLIAVNISILDINDNAPLITVNTLSVSGEIEITENWQRSTFVAHIVVLDRDSGMNGQFRCILESDHFRLEPLFPGQYKMVTSALFDREKQDRYSVNIVCVDFGTILQSSSKHVLAKVLDVNDNVPRFDPETYVAHVPENNNIGVSIARVSASDEDVGDNGEVRYSIVGGNNNQGDLLSIDRHLGIVTANVVFDHEKHRLLEFQVTATDMGVRSLTGTGTLTVIVSDVNDTPPRFSQASYAFAIYENEPIGTVVGSVTSIDSDSPPHNTISFIADAQQTDYRAFDLNSDSGIIRTRESLDREIKGVYYFVIGARNEGFSGMASANVTIYVIDVNDMRPVVSFPNVANNTVHVSSSTRPGDHVTQIVARDDDIGVNSALRYDIVSGNGRSSFRIDQILGTIVVNQSLSGVAGMIFSLTIKVEDRGYPSHSTMAVLNIVVHE